MGKNKFSPLKYLQPVIHVLLWGLLIFSPYIFRNPNAGFNNWQYKLIINNAMLAALFYLNAFYLMPAFYKKRGVLVYLVSVIVCIALFMATSSYIDKLLFNMPRNPPEMHGGPPEMRDKPPGIGNGKPEAPKVEINGRRHQPDGGRFNRGGWFTWWLFTSSLIYVFVFAISFSYRIILDNARLEKVRKEKENEHLKTELSFLRSQVSPHFIFNILHSMVSLARKKSDLLEPSLIQLSNLMRYMLYEGHEEKVSLEREVNYLKSYIDLQMLRFGDDVTVTFNTPENLDGYQIEPMLLAPFVENAFKHGIGMVEKPEINIVLTVDEKTGWLDFKVMNMVVPDNTSKDRSSGIGLVNVKRRLELLYRDGFSLHIDQTKSVFIALLKIKLT